MAIPTSREASRTRNTVENVIWGTAGRLRRQANDSGLCAAQAEPIKLWVGGASPRLNLEGMQHGSDELHQGGRPQARHWQGGGNATGRLARTRGPGRSGAGAGGQGPGARREGP